MNKLAAPRFLPAGESALVVEFGAAIDPHLNDHVCALDAALAAADIGGIIETVPTYRSLMIHFDPQLVSTAELIDSIGALKPAFENVQRTTSQWIIPACYEEPFAEDLPEVATRLCLAAGEIVKVHADATYRVYMYGFSPGYVFLGGLPDELKIPRRPVPRPPVPAGALLIAGAQALIGHDPMPTGWYLIGRTPVSTFDPHCAPPCFIEVGDRISFAPIDAARFAALEEEARRGAPVARRVG